MMITPLQVLKYSGTQISDQILFKSKWQHHLITSGLRALNHIIFNSRWLLHLMTSGSRVLGHQIIFSLDQDDYFTSGPQVFRHQIRFSSRQEDYFNLKFSNIPILIFSRIWTILFWQAFHTFYELAFFLQVVQCWYLVLLQRNELFFEAVNLAFNFG